MSPTALVDDTTALAGVWETPVRWPGTSATTIHVTRRGPGVEKEQPTDRSCRLRPSPA
jgi:hypothetical protein